MWYKDQDQTEMMDERCLSLELLKSIREIEVRINELKNITTKYCPILKKETLITKLKRIVFLKFKKQKNSNNFVNYLLLHSRIDRLVNTRIELLYSFARLNEPKLQNNTSSINPFNKIYIDHTINIHHIDDKMPTKMISNKKISFLSKFMRKSNA